MADISPMSQRGVASATSGATVRTTRLAIVTSHPIQYQGPWFRLMAQRAELRPHVFFCCDHGQKTTLDRDFKTSFAWERDITAGYSHEYLPSIHPEPSPYGFWRLTNPALVRRLNRSEFDALLLVGWNYASCWLAMATARARGIPVLMRAESGDIAWHRRPLWKRVARQPVITSMVRGLDACLAIGTDNAHLYRKHGVPDERIFSSPYCVDNDYFIAHAKRARQNRRELRVRWGVLDERPIVLASGKLIDRKAPLDLLHAFAQARRSVNAHVVFAGDGPLREQVEVAARAAGIESDVTITGFLQQRELADAYAAADLFAHPSHFESWGLVLNEAMLFGLPTICTDGASAHRDLIAEGVTGDVYPAGDVASLARILEMRLGNPSVLRQMGEAARRRVSSFSLERAVESVVVALDYVRERRAS